MNKLSANSSGNLIEVNPPIIPEQRHTTQCREFGPSSQRCLNPLCDKSVEPKRKHAPVKFYCSADCAQVVSLLKRVREKLKDLSDEEIVRVIRSR